MRARMPIMIAVGLSLLLASPARAGVTISNFRDGPDGAMEGTVSASGYGPCSGTDTDGCFATYLHGYIRADDGACPPGDGDPAVAAVLPRDGSPVTEAVDGDPAVRGWNRLCAYIERVYWSGAAAVIGQGSAVAYSKGPFPVGDLHDDCPGFPDGASAQRGGSACNDDSSGERLVLGPGAPLPRPRPSSLSGAEARRQITRVLKRFFRRSFNKRGLPPKCRRRTRARIACRVAWSARARHFEGTVAIRKVGRTRYRYSLRIKKLDRRGRSRLVRRSGSL